jgi:hypothetical protein
MRYTLSSLQERTLDMVRPPVAMHAVLVEQPALIVEAVGELMPDNGAKRAEIAGHGPACSRVALEYIGWLKRGAEDEPVSAEERLLQDGAGNEQSVCIALVKCVNICAAKPDARGTRA